MSFIKRDGLLVTSTPAIGVGAYGAGDVLGAPVKLSDVVGDTKALVYLKSLVVLDVANQKQELDILFFESDPGNVGADNAAVALSAAQLALVVGIIKVAAADYITVGARAVAQKNLEMLIPTKVKTTDVWVVYVSRGTPTYGAVDGLKFKYNFERL